MKVTRVHDGGSSYIEPPLEQSWSNLEKLEWQAAVVSEDTGIEHINVTRSHYTIGSILQRGYYCVEVGFGRSIAPLNFHQAWSYLNGVSTGVEVSTPSREPELLLS